MICLNLTTFHICKPSTSIFDVFKCYLVLLVNTLTYSYVIFLFFNLIPVRSSIRSEFSAHRLSKLLLFLLLPHFAHKAMHLSYACRILPSSNLRLPHTSPFQQSPSPFLELRLRRRRSLNLLSLDEEKSKKKSDGHGEKT